MKMRHDMPLATLKDKGQITLPSAVRKQLHVDKGDIFNFEVVEGQVIMTPQKIIPTNDQSAPKHKQVDISKYIGAGKGLYGSVEEIDAHIRKERDAWG